MSRIFLFFRWTVFALFIVCNAMICSVAAWSLGMVPTGSHMASVDIYLILVGALGLISIFPIIFVDIARKNATTSQVRFEATWLSLYWILILPGAASASAIMPPILCDARVTAILTDPCQSTKLLLAFAWLATITVGSYVVALVSSAVMHQKQDRQVWRSGVRDFPWFATQQCLRSAPGTPVMARFSRKTPSLVVPKPRRAAPPPLFVQRGGLNSKYEIEHYTLPEGSAEHPAPVPPPPAARTVTALYPTHMQSSLTNLTSQMQYNTERSPPPLGNWPQPISSQRQRATSSPGRSAHLHREGGSPAQVRTPRKTSIPQEPISSSPPRPRPSGPRTRTSSSAGSRTRPPPLDLTAARAY